MSNSNGHHPVGSRRRSSTALVIAKRFVSLNLKNIFKSLWLPSREEGGRYWVWTCSRGTHSTWSVHRLSTNCMNGRISPRGQALSSSTRRNVSASRESRERTLLAPLAGLTTTTQNLQSRHIMLTTFTAVMFNLKLKNTLKQNLY